MTPYEAGYAVALNDKPESAPADLTDDDDGCAVCGRSDVCEHCSIDEAEAFKKISPEVAAEMRARLPPRVTPERDALLREVGR